MACDNSSCPDVIKVLVQFPGATAQTPNDLSNVSVPGMVNYGTSASFLSSAFRGFGTGPVFAEFEKGAHQVNLPRRAGRPPAAVTVASDSPIHTCDIWIAGQGQEPSRFRVSPGIPLYLPQTDGHDFVYVTIPIGMPLINAGATPILWDAQKVVHTAAGFSVWTLPLKLNVWYGTLPPHASDFRSPYVAKMDAVLGAGESAFMYVCLDGRKSCSVHTLTSSAGLTLTVNGHYAFPARTPAPMIGQDTDATPVAPIINAAVASGYVKTDFTAAMMGFTYYLFGITDSIGNAVPSQLHVIARD